MKPSKIAKSEFVNSFSVNTNRGKQYDELVIKWNDLPRDTKVSFYFPEWNADEVIQLANSLRNNPFPLVKLDANTIGCSVSEITYLPVPAAGDNPYAGLLTLQLPLGVKTGQIYKIDVQQHSGPVIMRMTGRETGTNHSTGSGIMSYSTRKVLAAFRLIIPVKDSPSMLGKAVRNLAVLKYIFLAIPATDQWHPVFMRYIKQLEDKVRGLGVDPNEVKPSADDPGIPGIELPGGEKCYRGKICEIYFDCFGEFEGFILCTCSDKMHFKTKERSIAELALRACRDRLTISVCVEGKKEQKIKRIIIYC